MKIFLSNVERYERKISGTKKSGSGLTRLKGVDVFRIRMGMRPESDPFTGRSRSHGVLGLLGTLKEPGPLKETFGLRPMLSEDGQKTSRLHTQADIEIDAGAGRN